MRHRRQPEVELATRRSCGPDSNAQHVARAVHDKPERCHSLLDSLNVACQLTPPSVVAKICSAVWSLVRSGATTIQHCVPEAQANSSTNSWRSDGTCCLRHVRPPSWVAKMPWTP